MSFGDTWFPKFLEVEAVVGTLIDGSDSVDPQVHLSPDTIYAPG